MKKEAVNAIGIFQGGGVKLTVYVGALKSCSENNINFVRYAGTSGGAIIAALVAAGYSYSELEELLIGTNFEKLIAPAEENLHHFEKIKTPFLIRNIAKRSRFKSAFKAYTNYGFYSLIKLEKWLNTILCHKLGVNEKKYARFSDLEIPLIIISADLVEGGLKIFSKERTPNDSIAYAVRASASIPFVFQPLTENNSVLVDGGIISNLPISIVEREIVKKWEQGLPKIAFSIKSINPKHSDLPWSTMDYIERLVNIISDGNVEIQRLNIPSNTHLINIKVSEIKATDFKIMTEDMKRELFLSGYSEAKSYFDKIENLHSKVYMSHPKVFYGHEDVLTLIQDLIANAKRDICFYVDEFFEKITYSMVLSLVLTRIRGVKISFVIFPKVDSDLDRSSLKLLNQIGVTVIKNSSSVAMPFKGVIIDKDTDIAKIALIESSDDEVNNYCVLYNNASDKQIFRMLLGAVRQYFSKIVEVENTYIPEIVPIEIEFLIERFRKILFYESSEVEIVKEEINPMLTIPHTKFVRNFKINQLKYFRKYLAKNKFKSYDPLGIKLKNSNVSLINPPVFERRIDGMLHVIEGHNRIYYSRMLRETNLIAIVIENVEDDMPSKQYSWHEVEILSNKADEDETNKDNIKELLRRIESATHVRDEWN